MSSAPTSRGGAKRKRDCVSWCSFGGAGTVVDCVMSGGWKYCPLPRQLAGRAWNSKQRTAAPCKRQLSVRHVLHAQPHCFPPVVRLTAALILDDTTPQKNSATDLAAGAATATGKLPAGVATNLPLPCPHPLRRGRCRTRMAAVGVPTIEGAEGGTKCGARALHSFGEGRRNSTGRQHENTRPRPRTTPHHTPRHTPRLHGDHTIPVAGLRVHSEHLRAQTREREEAVECFGMCVWV